MSTTIYSVYILWSQVAGKFYIGVTSDVHKRLYQHNVGVSKWTSRYAGTWRLVWDQTCASLGEARKLENKIKAQKGGQGFWTITGLAKLDFTDTVS